MLCFQVKIDPATGVITLGAAIPLIPPSTNCSNGYIHFVGSMVPENAPANSSSVNSSLACFADMAAGSVSAHAVTPGVSVSHGMLCFQAQFGVQWAHLGPFQTANLTDKHHKH